MSRAGSRPDCFCHFPEWNRIDKNAGFIYIISAEDNDEPRAPVALRPLFFFRAVQEFVPIGVINPIGMYRREEAKYAAAAAGRETETARAAHTYVEPCENRGIYRERASNETLFSILDVDLIKSEASS